VHEPVGGRGLTVGFKHAVALRNVLRDGRDDPGALVQAFDEVTESRIAPWYHAQIADDRARFADMESLREGREPVPPSDGLAVGIRSLRMAMAADADLFRAGLEYIGTLTTVQEILQRPAVAEGIRAAREATRGRPPFQFPGPDRTQLLALVA
jgi:hypothetical protein